MRVQPVPPQKYCSRGVARNLFFLPARATLPATERYDVALCAVKSSCRELVFVCPVVFPVLGGEYADVASRLRHFRQGGCATFSIAAVGQDVGNGVPNSETLSWPSKSGAQDGTHYTARFAMYGVPLRLKSLILHCLSFAGFLVACVCQRGWLPRF